MKVLIDLNVMLDFLLKRPEFFEDAASIMDMILAQSIVGVIPLHAVTTVSYFLKRSVTKLPPDEIINWMLIHFEIPSAGVAELEAALALGMRDYEDAVTSVVAQRAHCQRIITRNARDFARSPVPALGPSEFLNLL